MPDNTIQIRVNADLSKAQQAMTEGINTTALAMSRTVAQSAKEQGASLDEVSQIYKQLGMTGAQAATEIAGAFGGAAGGGAPTPSGGTVAGSLISSRMSTQLLAQEIGLHLPRAVTSAVGSMIPQIGGLGEAFLAVFAVEEIYRFGKAVRDLYADFDGVKEAEKEMAGYVRENTSLVEELARKSSIVAQAELHRMQVASLNAHAALNELEARRDLLELYMGPMAAFVAKALGQTTELNDLKKQSEQIDQDAAAMAKIYINDQDEGARKAAHAAEEHARKVAELVREEQRALDAVRKRIGPEIVRAIREQREEEDRSADAAAKHALFLEKLNGELVQELPLLSHSNEYMRQQLPIVTMLANATHHLTQEQIFEIGVLQKIRAEAGAAKEAMGGLASATIQAGVGAAISGQRIGRAMEQALKSTLTSIAVEASVRALYNVGLGIYYEAIHDPVDAGLAFSAAAVFGAVAGAAGTAAALIPGGGRGGSRGGRGGSAGGDGSNSAAAPGYGSGSSAQGTGSQFGAPGSGVVIIRGTQAFEDHVAAAVNSAVARGVNVTATSSVRGAAVGH